MQIEYEDTSVKELFLDLELVKESRGLMKKAIGFELTRAVKKRYNQLKAADNFSVYLSTGLGKPHVLAGTNGCYGIHITANWRLVIKPLTDELSSESLKKCDAIQIKGVVDYHGKGAKNNWLIP